MAFDPVATQDIIVSHAKRLGIFDRVHAHEPKSAPGNGLTAAIWADAIDPITGSGLKSTSIRVGYYIRVYCNMLKEPQDGIDRALLTAGAGLMSAFSGDFTFEDEAREVDLLGTYGVPLSGKAGYLNHDNKLFRVFVLTLPIIFNDVFEQVA